MKRIACTNVNGLKLRLFKQGFDDGTGTRPMVQDGPAVTLKGASAVSAGTSSPSSGEPCVTEVDDEFWSRWVEQNRGKNPLFDDGHVYDLDERRGGAEEGTDRSEEPAHDDAAPGHV